MRGSIVFHDDDAIEQFGHVYIGENIFSNGLFKVGASCDVNERVRCLKLQDVSMSPPIHRKQLAFVEYAVHKRLKQYRQRVGREWYRFPSDVIEEIRDYITGVG